MPRKHLSKIHDFYEYIDGRSICQVTDVSGNVCEVAVKGRHAGNLEKHVYRNHETVWNDYYHNFKLPSLAKDETFSTPAPKRPKLLLEYVKITDTALDSVSFTYKTLEKACITMATVDGRPLSFVEDVGFRMILSPLLQIMNSADRKDYTNFAMNKNKLQKLIREESESIKMNAIKRISSKLICLKIDCASIRGKHYLCCSVFSRDCEDTSVFTLPLIEILDFSDAESVKITILENLSMYGILPAQIYAMIVDSTENVLSNDHLQKDENIDELLFDESNPEIDKESKAVEDLKSDTLSICKKENPDDPDANNDQEYDTFVIEVDYESHSNDVQSTSTQANNEQPKLEDLINKVIECWSNEDMNCAVCPAHIFELVIKDALKISNVVNLPKKIRDIIKKFRSSEYTRVLHSHCKRTLILDQPERWISTYEMLHKLLELKPYLKKMTLPKELFISAALWNQISDYVTSYGPIKAALQRLHTENVPLSEFFKIWTACALRTKKIGTPLAKTLAQIMDQQQNVFYQNTLFLSCLFLDPRFKNILGEEYLPNIIDHLSELYLKIVSLKTEDENYEIDFVDMSEYKNETNFNESSICNRTLDKDVDDFIKSMIKLPSADENPSQVKQKIQSLLVTFFESEPLLGVQEDVLKFWNEKKYAYPELYKISQTVFAISASHYSINKMSSQLKYLYNPHFNVSLTLPIVNDILNVRVNCDAAKFK